MSWVGKYYTVLNKWIEVNEFSIYYNSLVMITVVLDPSIYTLGAIFLYTS